MTEQERVERVADLIVQITANLSSGGMTVREVRLGVARAVIADLEAEFAAWVACSFATSEHERLGTNVDLRGCMVPGHNAPVTLKHCASCPVPNMAEALVKSLEVMDEPGDLDAVALAGEALELYRKGGRAE
jgi:hypothetical protein